MGEEEGEEGGGEAEREEGMGRRRWRRRLMQADWQRREGGRKETVKRLAGGAGEEPWRWEEELERRRV